MSKLHLDFNHYNYWYYRDYNSEGKCINCTTLFAISIAKTKTDKSYNSLNSNDYKSAIFFFSWHANCFNSVEILMVVFGIFQII